MKTKEMLSVLNHTLSKNIYLEKIQSVVRWVIMSQTNLTVYDDYMYDTA